MQQYSFPGNVRELENILERAVALCEDNVIEAVDLRLPQHRSDASAFAAPVPGSAIGTAGLAVPAAALTPAPPGASGDLENYIDNLQREAIMKALQETRYNKTKAAQVLGITFRALRYKLKKLGIE